MNSTVFRSLNILKLSFFLFSLHNKINILQAAACTHLVYLYIK